MISKEITQNVIAGMHKLINTIDHLTDTKMLAISYYTKTHELYSDLSQKFTIQIEQADRQIIQKSFTLPGSCQQILPFTKIFKKLTLYLQSMGSLNLADIKSLDQNSKWFQSKIKSKIQNFLKEVASYKKKEESYNDKYMPYRFQCLRLSQKINKLNGFEEPICFYDPKIFKEPSKDLDKQLNVCENMETSLLSQLLILDDRRKFLTISLCQIKEQFLSLLHLHMQSLVKVISSFVSESKEEQIVNKVKGMIKMFEIQQGFYSAGLEQFQGRESVMRGQADLADQFQMFQKMDNYHFSDCVIFMDQCSSYYNKKIKKGQQSIELQKIFIKNLKIFSAYINQMEKGFKKANKDVFKSYGVINFKKRLFKYFGSNIVSLFDLSLSVIDNPKRRLDKIDKILQNNIEKIMKLVSSKEQQLIKFKRRMQTIFNEHKIVKQSNGKKQQNIKELCKKNYKYIEKISDELNQNQKDFDQTFFQEVRRIIHLVTNQVNQSQLKIVLKKQKEQRFLNILKNLEVHGEILTIFKEDQRYDVFFDSSLNSGLSQNFQSLIRRKEFEQKKKILQKKEYMFGDKTIGCCGGYQSVKVSKSSILLEYSGSIINMEGLLKEGMIQIMRNGVRFKQKNWNPFYQEVELVIPKAQILDFSEPKNKKIEIMTKMGVIVIVCKDVEGLFTNLNKNFERTKKKKQMDSQNSYGDNYSSNNSVLKGRTSYIAYDSRNCETRDRTSKITKHNKLNLPKEIIKHLESIQIFSPTLELIFNKQKDGKMRRDYIFEENMIKFLVKERGEYKSDRLGQKQFVYIIFEWKISFPEMPMLKSFCHSQSVRIEMTPTPHPLKIICIEKKREDEVLFTRSKFYNEVKIWNKRLPQILGQFCERSVEAFVEQEKQDEQMTIQFNLQQTTLDKKTTNESRTSKFFMLQMLKNTSDELMH